ncbi:MAG: hypothetical protein EXS26_03865 [Opitutales bacterium]|nr:hypothetical protein [Opitutales bacterium]
MHTLLASLIFLAAGEVAPPPIVSDEEVVRYLQPYELVEWNSAMLTTTVGEARVKQGLSIMNIATGKSASPNVPKIGGLDEAPEQAKARAQKVIDEGKAQIRQAIPSLTRLRVAAAARAAELTKPVEFKAEFPQQPWGAAVAQAVGRLQKQVRDTGFPQTHLIGGFALLGDGKLSRPEAVTVEVRAAWIKLDARSLAAVPSAGYTYVPASGASAPALAKTLKPTTAPKQVAVVWAEFYALDGAIGLLCLRLADAHTMRIIGSEVALTELGGPTTTPRALTASLSFLDERSFLPRLGQSGEWVLGFDRASNPLGSALLTHLSSTQTKAIIAAAPYVVIVAGGGPAGADGIRAKWNVVQDQAAGNLEFAVSSQATGMASVGVGQLTLKLVAPEPAK